MYRRYETLNGRKVAVLYRIHGEKQTMECLFCEDVHMHGEPDGHRIPHCGKDMVINETIAARDGSLLKHSDGYILRNLSISDFNCFLTGDVLFEYANKHGLIFKEYRPTQLRLTYEGHAIDIYPKGKRWTFVGSQVWDSYDRLEEVLLGCFGKGF